MSIKLPPQNLEAERSVLGALLIDNDVVFKISDILKSEDFYKNEHKIIYEAMMDLSQNHQPIDVLTLTDLLEKRKKLKEVGGASYVSEVVNSTATSANVVAYAQIIRDRSVLRNLISSGSKIVELGFREERDTTELLDEAERMLFQVTQGFLKETFVPIKDVLAGTFERIDELNKNKGKMRGVPTGYRELDSVLAGLQNSDLVVLAARPSMGKTSFAISIAINAAVNHKVPVGFFSIEQSRDQIVDRMLVSVAGIDSWRLRTGNLSESDFPKIGNSMGILSEAPIYIDDTPLLNVMEMRAKSRRLQMEKGLGLIVIDYMQLMEGNAQSKKEGSRVQEMSEISRGIKAIARELNVPVMALSQLSRAVEMRHPKIPQLADLRDSGSIEQDADVVMFIYREDYYNPETDRKNIADIFVKKHRNGPTGQTELYFVPEQMKFQDIEKKEYGVQSANQLVEEEY
ncbi:replicative DNA helicase [Candidatus Berkelbacteria bacterium CG_4_9_14_3_um_filter_39_23]|uniref:Replicative DNA helicase n=2 Tax=Candidatus Berkelbacteria TaxID=1618330 RepID=A0A2M7CI97_9BACT|nr:replicative DNA helicase [Candidatus Berkelbacteria bacterium]PIR27699.1 MAG: replicative DNA helicase [Candidatus Berkelbacteria bacterium CG11_big_fil_rev_8_21_14_0_20_40_23]PIV25370.1 MAG: replicative DNA helicase [Candidatus Berkelbacteria bacterium CG03_land_8_20_14_0_80_40_36]PIX30894.1 MAG: replicative DNA helicase [Candidatus Berkelbacteria bacterium CG_4_8_14_3_um_filter_39_27]PIZ29194.1 MAG: replicative DNA helicase [Candidatus Berkelbacteria bacterium CG_4_10_14_0_8_um_filter_39_4